MKILQKLFMLMKNKIILLWCLIIGSGALYAQDENESEKSSQPLVTDRPDATEASSTVKPTIIGMLD